MIVNIPKVKLGIIAVSRDCFPISLATKRREKIVGMLNDDLYNCKITVENEQDALKAVEDVIDSGCNALVVLLGNFGPETSETILAQKFNGPCMFVGSAEEEGDLIDGRGDAYCGLLNCSYNIKLRGIKNAYIPCWPIGTSIDIVEMIKRFVPIARAYIGLRKLKIISFGPRPQDFFSCNAPIQGLYDMGIEIEENSELDLLMAYRKHKNDSRIPKICTDMAEEMGEGNYYPDLNERMAQFELTLLDWAEEHKGSREYIAFANKCWPAFPVEFGFEPCYVNSRLVSQGIPVGCEVDIYGALSEYIGICLTEDTVTLLDINNTIPSQMYEGNIRKEYGYKPTDVFMGFHCGNTPSCKLCSDRSIKYMLIQHRLLEPKGSNPDITRGTLEGDLLAGPITLYRVQCTAKGELKAYVAEGEILDVPTGSFGGRGILGIREMSRFYRNVLIEKGFPHHGAVAFSHIGHEIFEFFKYIGIKDISYNRPVSMLYENENPF